MLKAFPRRRSQAHEQNMNVQAHHCQPVGFWERRRGSRRRCTTILQEKNKVWVHNLCIRRSLEPMVASPSTFKVMNDWPQNGLVVIYNDKTNEDPSSTKGEEKSQCAVLREVRDRNTWDRKRNSHKASKIMQKSKLQMLKMSSLLLYMMTYSLNFRGQKSLF